MSKDLNIPHCIKNYGADSYPCENGFVPEEVFLERLPEIAKNAILDACTGSNPRQPSQEEMEKLLKFITEHADSDVSRLILDKGKYPDVDISLAVNCIESRRKLKGKVMEWHENPSLIFPLKLSAEQCSSSATGRHKARTACRIAMTGRNGADESRGYVHKRYPRRIVSGVCFCNKKQGRKPSLFNITPRA